MLVVLLIEVYHQLRLALQYDLKFVCQDRFVASHISSALVLSDCARRGHM